jgi:3-oxoadipate enol-lactonase
MAYSLAGRGPTVVLVHGIGEDRRCWERQRPSLVTTHRVVTCDVRGHGQTPAGDAQGTLEQLRDDLIALLESIGAGPATLIGYSLGGTIVLATAAQRPDLVNAVVAIATSSVVGSRAAASYEHRAALIARGDRAGLKRELARDLQQSLVRDIADAEELLRWELEAIGDGAGYRNAALAMAGLHGDPLTPQLAHVRAPTLVIGGERDEWCPPRAQEIICTALPDARYVQIDDAGHLLLEENHALVTEAITTFLKELKHRGPSH